MILENIFNVKTMFVIIIIILFILSLILIIINNINFNKKKGSGDDCCSIEYKQQLENDIKKLKEEFKKITEDHNVLTEEINNILNSTENNDEEELKNNINNGLYSDFHLPKPFIKYKKILEYLLSNSPPEADPPRAEKALK